MTPHPLLAAFLGGWEIIIILVTLIMLLLMVITVIGVISYFISRRHGMTLANPPVVPMSPTPAETAQTPPGNCPHCGKPVPPTALGDLCPECMLKAGLATQTEGPAHTGPHGTKVVPPLPKPEEIAPLFPQLEILECLGRGGMGVVYKARQPRLNRLVALKILAREKEKDAQFAERFTREAQALARLNHPNIVTVHDFGEVGGHCYLVMEFVDGLNLRQLLQTGKMPPEQALTIVPKICEALQYAHEQGIVHRDIKPENILLDKSGRVKIADFGIAKILGAESGQQTLTGAKDAVGTPHYMAPEQIEKPLTVDHRADIYSLGVVFYEMLTGELPLGKFQPPSKKVQIDVRLDEVVLHALEKEPERRYQQANILKTDVETIVTKTGETRRAWVLGARQDKPPFVRAVELLSGVTFTSPLAIKLVNVSAFGFLGFLAFLGYLPLPEMRFCFGFSCLFAFFGLIGIAFLIELRAPGKNDASGGAKRSVRRINAGVICALIAAVSLILAGITEEKVINELPEIQNLESNSTPSEISHSTFIQSWSTMIHIRRYVLLPLGIGGIIGATVFGVLAALQLALPKPSANSPAAEAWMALFFSGLGCVFVVVTACLWPNPPQGLVQAIIVAVLLGMALGILAREHRLGKTSMGMSIWLAILISIYFLHEKPDYSGQALLQNKVKYAATQASVQDIVQNLAEQAGLKYDWQKSFAQTDPLCRQWVRNVTIEGETCQQALDQILKPVGLRYQVEDGALVLSRQDEGTTKSDYIGQADFPQGDSIEITSVERTEKQMTVKGHYNLVSHDQAELALYITTKTNIAVPTDSTQTKEIFKGTGEFELIHSHLVPGWPHVSMYADGGSFAALYFGTKEEAAEEGKLPKGWSLATGKENAAKLAKLGWQLWQSGKLAEAEEKFQQVVQLAPGDANAWNGLGWAEFNSGNSGKAEKAFQKAVSIEPDQPGALNGLGQIYLSQRKYDQAESYLLKAAPQAPAAWYGLTRLYLLQGKYDQAEKWAQDLIDAGQADDLVRQMLKAAQEKNLSDGLRFRIEPPAPATQSTSPTQMMTGANSPANSAAINAVNDWLSLADNGAYAETWDTAAASFHDAITKSDWVAKLEEVRRPIGKLVSRKLHSTEPLKALPGMPEGSYFVAKFDTAFASFKPATETVIFSLEKDGRWKAVRYTILPGGSEDAAVISDEAKPAVSAAEKWLESIDHGRYAKSWTDASGYFRNAITQDKWVSSLESIRKPLSNVVSREAISAQQMTEMPGAPDGKYMVMQFNTSFANKKFAIETVAFMLEKDGHWKAAGYFIK